jgi:hypothetical protein
MDVYSLQLFMGHEKIDTTAKYFVQSPDAMARMRAVLAARDAPVTHGPVELASVRAATGRKAVT